MDGLVDGLLSSVCWESDFNGIPDSDNLVDLMGTPLFFEWLRVPIIRVVDEIKFRKKDPARKANKPITWTISSFILYSSNSDSLDKTRQEFGSAGPVSGTGDDGVQYGIENLHKAPLQSPKEVLQDEWY